MTWTVEQRWFGDSSVRLTFVDEFGPVTWRTMLARWREPDEAQRFADALLAPGFDAVHWECPPQFGEDFAEPFECVLHDAPSLLVSSDPRPFAEHLATTDSTATFTSLGRDATLVIPTRSDAGRNDMAHLAGFLRTASRERIAALWHAVAEAVSARATRPQPFWLSTAGGGVAWLHVRLDDRPKYYHHKPYC